MSAIRSRDSLVNTLNLAFQLSSRGRRFAQLMYHSDTRKRRQKQNDHVVMFPGEWLLKQGDEICKRRQEDTGAKGSSTEYRLNLDTRDPQKGEHDCSWFYATCSESCSNLIYVVEIAD